MGITKPKSIMHIQQSYDRKSVQKTYL